MPLTHPSNPFDNVADTWDQKPISELAVTNKVFSGTNEKGNYLTVDNTFQGQLQKALTGARTNTGYNINNKKGAMSPGQYPFLFAGDPADVQPGLESQISEVTGLETFSSEFGNIGGDTMHVGMDDSDSDGPITPRSRRDFRDSIVFAPTPINTLEPISTSKGSIEDGDHVFPRGDYSITSGGSVLPSSVPDVTVSEDGHYQPSDRTPRQSNASSKAPSSASNRGLLPNPNQSGPKPTVTFTPGQTSPDHPYSNKAMNGRMPINNIATTITTAASNPPTYPFAYPDTFSNPSIGNSLPANPGSTFGASSAGSRMGNKPLLDSASSVQYELDYSEAEEGSPGDQATQDRKRLEALGYDEVLGRDYGFWASYCLALTNVGVFAGPLLGILTTFSYGGPTMILAMFPLGGFIQICLTLSMGELSSAYPVAGAMASWTWKVARGGVGGERYWSWVIAGFTVGYHTLAIASGTYSVATLIEDSIVLNVPTYIARTWHMILFSLVLLALIGIVQSVKWGRSPKMWIGIGIAQLIFYIGLLVSLFVKGAGQQSIHDLYTSPFANHSGWDNKALVYLLGWTLSSIASGWDASAHMAEETRNPSRNVPLAMVAATTTVYVAIYPLLIAMLLSIGDAQMEAVSTSSFPPAAILASILGLKATLTILAILIVFISFGNLAGLQASSRFIWAMGRDNVIPFSGTFKRTNSQKLPVNAVWLAVGISSVMILLIWTDPQVLSGIIGSSGGSFALISYSTPVALYLFSKINLAYENRSAFSIRRFSKPVATIASLGTLLFIVLFAFPTSFPVVLESVSWEPVTIAGALIFSAITWKFYGNKNYSGPVKAITKHTAGVEIDLQDALKRPKVPVQAPRPSQVTADSARVGQGPWASTPSNPLPATVVSGGVSYGNNSYGINAKATGESNQSYDSWKR